MAEGITPRQLVKLQTLWGHHYRLAAEPGQGGNAAASRADRLAWLSETTGRAVASAKELTNPEAEKAIRELMKRLPEHLRGRRRRMSGQRARELGTAGRRGATGTASLPGAAELAAIEELKAALGWDNVKFDAWLRSRYSPVRGVVRTLADANRVRWALKAILKRQQNLSETDKVA